MGWSQPPGPVSDCHTGPLSSSASVSGPRSCLCEITWALSGHRLGLYTPPGRPGLGKGVQSLDPRILPRSF